MIANSNRDENHYYAHDHLYSPVALLDDSGTIVERYEYNAYGKLTRLDPDFTAWSGTPVGNPVFFTGQRLDELDSGDLPIMYYKYRYYSTEVGRFITRDPIGVVEGMNIYAYVLNNPCVRLDKLGLLGKNCMECVPPAPGKKNIYDLKFVGVGSSTGIGSPSTVNELEDGIGNLDTLIGVIDKVEDAMPDVPIPDIPLPDIPMARPPHIQELTEIAMEQISEISDSLAIQRGKYLWLKVRYKSCVPCTTFLSKLRLWGRPKCGGYWKWHEKWHPCPNTHYNDQGGEQKIFSNDIDPRTKRLNLLKQFKSALKSCAKKAFNDPANPGTFSK